jgi:hypothetical protein
VRTTPFWNNHHQVRSKSKGWKPNNLKSFGSNTDKSIHQPHQKSLFNTQIKRIKKVDIKFNAHDAFHKTG